MGYAQLEDTFWCHPKIIDLPPLAFRLYVRALSFSSALNTDGIVSLATLKVLDANPKLAGNLVDAGLWEVEDRGWRIHDFHDYNASKAKRAAAKKAASARWNSSTHDAPDPPTHDAESASAHDAPPTDPQMPADSESAHATHAHGRSRDRTGAGTSTGLRISEAEDGEPLALAFADVFDSVKSWLGHELSRTELERVSSAIEDYGDERVRTAVQTAKDAGNTGLSYMLTIARNNPNGTSKTPAVIGQQWGTSRFTDAEEVAERKRIYDAQQRFREGQKRA